MLVYKCDCCDAIEDHAYATVLGVDFCKECFNRYVLNSERCALYSDGKKYAEAGVPWASEYPCKDEE